MSQQSADTWEVVLCLNCNEKILVTRPHRLSPGRTHPSAYRPYPPYLTVYCKNCGHYTVLSPETCNREN